MRCVTLGEEARRCVATTDDMTRQVGESAPTIRGDGEAAPRELSVLDLGVEHLEIPEDARKALVGIGIRTVGELMQRPAEAYLFLFGPNEPAWTRLAMGLDRLIPDSHPFRLQMVHFLASRSFGPLYRPDSWKAPVSVGGTTSEEEETDGDKREERVLELEVAPEQEEGNDDLEAPEVPGWSGLLSYARALLPEQDWLVLAGHLGLTLLESAELAGAREIGRATVLYTVRSGLKFLEEDPVLAKARADLRGLVESHAGWLVLGELHAEDGFQDMAEDALSDLLALMCAMSGPTLVREEPDLLVTRPSLTGALRSLASKAADALPAPQFLVDVQEWLRENAHVALNEDSLEVVPAQIWGVVTLQDEEAEAEIVVTYGRRPTAADVAAAMLFTEGEPLSQDALLTYCEVAFPDVDSRDLGLELSRDSRFRSCDGSWILAAAFRAGAEQDESIEEAEEVKSDEQLPWSGLLARAKSLLREPDWAVLIRHLGFRRIDTRHDVRLTGAALQNCLRLSLEALARDEVLTSARRDLRALVEEWSGWLSVQELNVYSGSLSPDELHDLVTLLCALPGDSLVREEPELVVTRPVTTELLRIQANKVAAELPAPQLLSTVQDWLRDHVDLDVEESILEAVPARLWKSVFLDDPNLESEIVLSYGPRYSAADVAAAMLVTESEPLPFETLREMCLEAFPDLDILSLEVTLSHDPRFRNDAEGGWSLAEKAGAGAAQAADEGLQGTTATYEAEEPDDCEEEDDTQQPLARVAPPEIQEAGPQRGEMTAAGGLSAPPPAEAVADLLDEVLSASPQPLSLAELEASLRSRRPTPVASLQAALQEGERFLRTEAGWTVPRRQPLDDEVAGELRNLALAAAADAPVVLCRKTSWRQARKEVPETEVDLALQAEPGLHRVAPGAYVSAARTDEWEGRPLLDRVLWLAGDPLEFPEARRRLAEHGRPLSELAFYQLVEASSGIAQYPFGIPTLLGLEEWGARGYAQAALLRWPEAQPMARHATDLPEPLRLGLLKAALQQKDNKSFNRLRELRSTQAGGASRRIVVPSVPGEERVAEWERLLRPQLAGLQLLGELDLSKEAHERLGRDLREVLRRKGISQGLTTLETRYPTSLAAYLAFEGVYAYESGTLWPMICETLGVPYDSNHSVDLGRTFEAVLARLKLPTLEHVAGSPRYISKIIGHGGIPNDSLPGFFRYVVVPSVSDPLLHELTAAELLETLSHSGLSGLHKPAKKFLSIGGRFAEDLVERCRDLAREALRLRDVPEGDYGLPERITSGFREWWNQEGTGVEQVASPLPRPYLALDPWGEGLHVVFPAGRVSTQTASRASSVLWEVRWDRDSVCYVEECPTSGTRVSLPERALALGAPSRQYQCRVAVEGVTLGTFVLPGFDRGRPIRFFHPASGRALSQRVAARPVWAVYPAGRRLLLDGRLVEPLEEFPDLPGQWSEYGASWIDLEGGRQLQLRDHDRPEWQGTLAQEVRLELHGECALGADEAEAGIPVYVGSAPRMVVGVADLAEWTLQVGGPSGTLILRGGELEAQTDPVDGGRSLDLARLTGSAAGEYRVLLRGALGQDTRATFRLVPALRLRRSGAPLRPAEPGSWLLSVPRDARVLAAGNLQAPVDRSDSARYQVALPDGEMVMRVEVRYSLEDGAEYTLPLDLWRPQAAWALVGIEEGAGVRWQSQPGSVPLDVIEQAADRAPHLLLHLPVQSAEVRLVVPSEDMDRAQALPPVPVSRRTRYRARLPLGPLMDTLRSLRVATARLILEVDAGDEKASLHLVDVSRSWQPTALSASALRMHELVQVRLSWASAFETRHLRLRLWSLSRPWTAPLERPIDQAEGNEALVDFGARELPPGPYQAEVYLHDPWLPPERHPRRPDRTSAGNVPFTVGEDELLPYLERLPDTGLGHLERYLAQAESDRPQVAPARAMAQSLQVHELDPMLRTYIRLCRDDRRDLPIIVSLRDTYLADALRTRFESLVRMLPTLALDLAGSEERELVLGLLRVGVTVEPVEQLLELVRHHAPPAAEREALWQLWPPIGLLVDLHCQGPGREERLDRHLGAEWRSEAELQGKWGTPFQHEVRASEEALRAMWRALGVTPTAPMERESLQLAYFETLMHLRRHHVVEAAQRWVALEAPLVEREIQRVEAQGRLSAEAREALLGRHPLDPETRIARGELHDPLGRLPFVVGAVAFLQRLLAQAPAKEPSYGRDRLVQQTCLAFRFAPALLARDLCHAELACTPDLWRTE